MTLIVIGLLFLLREVNLSTHQMRQGLENAIEGAATDPSQPG
jgi:hypothetical protein